MFMHVLRFNYKLKKISDKIIKIACGTCFLFSRYKMWCECDGTDMHLFKVNEVS